MDFAIARRNMVDGQVRVNDVVDPSISRVLENTPREIFLPAAARALAYVEQEVEYAPGRHLLAMHDFSKLLAAAAPFRDSLVLNVVCGTGYSTAVLAQLSEMVVSLEIDDGLCAKAQENLDFLGLNNAAVIHGDPVRGAPEQGPYDIIFLDGVVETAPALLLEQLGPGGRLATVLRRNGVSRGVLYRNSIAGCSYVEKFDAASVSVLPGFSRKSAFVF